MKKSIKIVLICLFVAGMTTCLFSDAASQSFRLTFFSEIGQRTSGILPMTTEFDQGGNIFFNNFLAPKAGIYHFDGRVNFTFPLTDTSEALTDEPLNGSNENRHHYSHWYLQLYKNSKIIESTVLTNNDNALSTPRHSLSISTTVKVNKGDLISIKFIFDKEFPEQTVALEFASFSGFKVADLLLKIPR